jgi:tetratricopeptide (TPR) repeat protein
VKFSNVYALRYQLPLLALLCLLGWGTHRTNVALESQIYETRQPGHVGLLPDGKLLRVLSLGFDRFVADLFWLRTVNYIGTESSAKTGYPAAAQLGELVTDIDPHFKTAYSVINVVLTVLSHQPEPAIALLDKGIQHIDWWKLHFLQGYNYLFETKEYEKAAEQMALAAVKTGAPPYLKFLAPRLYAYAGDTDTAMAFVRARIEHATTEEEREALVRRYHDLWVTRDLRSINAALEAYEKEHGERPRDVQTLVQAGFLYVEPRDPAGNSYLVQDGVAVSSMEYDKLHVHMNP